MQQEDPQSLVTPQEHQLHKQQTVMLDLQGSKKPSKLPSICGDSAHPLVALFHIAFLIGVVFVYIALPIFFKPMTAYILMIVAGAIDFYYMKNIAGRLLVGMKWWFQITEDGYEVCRFQTKMDNRDIPTGNIRVFWDPIYLFMLIWFVLIVLNIISLSPPHLFICIFNFVLLTYNYKYFCKCYQSRGYQVQKLFVQHGHKKLAPYYRGSFIGHIDKPPKTQE